MIGTTWTERDRTLVEYYWLKGQDTSFIASTVDRTPSSVEALIREFRHNRPHKKPRKVFLQPRGLPRAA